MMADIEYERNEDYAYDEKGEPVEVEMVSGEATKAYKPVSESSPVTEEKLEEYTDFERVDFNNPSSILRYGEEVKEEIGRILDTTAQMSTETREESLDDKLVSEISSFDRAIDGKEKNALVAAGQTVKTGVKGFLGKMGIDKFKGAESAAYKERYEDYCEKIQRVCDAVSSQKEGALGDISLRNSIIEAITPLIEKLEKIIEVGKMDKDKFDASIAELKSMAIGLASEHEIQYKTQLSELFSGKLEELTKSVVLYREQVQSYRLQQRTDMEIVMNSDSYLRDTAPILKAQGSVMVFNKLQGKRIETIARLNEATNAAIQGNAKALEQNATGAVDLSLHRGVSTETLSKLNDSLQKGVDIFKQGRIKAKQQREADRKVIETTAASLKAYQEELLHLIDDEGVMSDLLGKRPELGHGPLQKKLGTPNSGNK